ncbi:tail assembly protein [Oligella sp. HMSC09E12]|uniref:tail assembly protein n=1 Tax=Oligella sp. HMSC09E12 TaxID=1581147 RepID=UPI0008A4072C|nr:tail assembly protein [Oligella sp. HMSC09E12]OFV49690.1 hypothetical protein HMPREF3179_03525 [Oligella sp. HMSC09E12]
MSKLRTVRLYGYLGSKYGRVHQLYVDNTAEAIRALCTQLEGFFEDLRDSEEKGIGFATFVGKQNLEKDDLENPVGDEDIRIAPVILGSKRGGIFSVILGVVLIAASFIVPGAGAFTVLGFAANGTLFMMGASLLLGGIAQMLAPQPKLDIDEQAVSPNKSFNGPVNTTANGGIVPLAIGKVMCGSAVISASIRAAQLANK